jgi:hypothetical protein
VHVQQAFVHVQQAFSRANHASCAVSFCLQQGVHCNGARQNSVGCAAKNVATNLQRLTKFVDQYGEKFGTELDFNRC